MKYLYKIEKKFKITYVILNLLTIFILLSNPLTLIAKELSVEEAIWWGIQNNLDLQNLRYSIEDIRRNLEIVEAGKRFQVDLTVTPIWRFSEKDNSYFVEADKNHFTPDTKINLSAKKLLTSRLSMVGEVSWQSHNFFENANNIFSDEIKANIRLDRKIFPKTLAEQERQVYSLENNLQIKMEELKWKEIEKQIEFIQKYLNIIRLQEQLDILFERHKLAEENMERVRAKIELGEGGYQQESEAIISLNEADNKLFSAKQELIVVQKQWYLLLNLSADAIVDFNSDDSFLREISKKMENLPTDDKIEGELIDRALKENYQTGNSELEIEELEKELQWTKDAGKPSANITGGYSYPDDNWFVMLDFSAKLTDGGIQKLKIKQKEDNLKRKKIGADYQLEMLRIEVEQLFAQDEYNQLFLRTQQLSLEKEVEKDKIIEQQFQQGLISQLQRTNNLLTLRERELAVKQAHDQWLIGRLKLAHFIGFLKKGV